MDPTESQVTSEEVMASSSNAIVPSSCEVSTEDRRNSSHNTMRNSQLSKKHGVGITGFERVTNPFYNLSAKMLWILSLFLLTIVSVYLVGYCIHNYFRGKPDVTVKFSIRNEIPLPTFIFCPYNLTLNKETKLLQHLYRETFKNSSEKDRVHFSDLLRLPNITVQKLWSPLEIKYNRTVKCSVSKADQACYDPDIQMVNTAAGECLVVKNKHNFKFFGRVTLLDYVFYLPEENKANWLQTDHYLKVYRMPKEENILYTYYGGNRLNVKLHMKMIAEVIEVKNVNAIDYPCENEVMVERCVDKCTEEKLLSRLKCSLPFMENFPLLPCKDPESFNVSFEALKDVMTQRSNCRKNCPRKCHEFLFIYDIQERLVKNHIYLEFEMFDRTIMSTEEYFSYTFSNLLADIGAILGFLLDSSLLSFLEICEVVFLWASNFLQRSYKNSKKLFQGFYYTRRNRFLQWNTAISKEEYKQKINIGIAGFDRFLCKTTGTFRKIMWLLIIVVATILCSIQISDTISSFMYEDPDGSLTIETNDTLKVPTVTFCPYRAFDYWETFTGWKQEWALQSNFSGPISISDLVEFKTVNIMDFWDSHGLFSNQFEIESDELRFDFQPIKTIYGLCLRLNIETPVIFRRELTAVYFGISNITRTVSNDPYMYAIHNEEDDSRTLDPNLWKTIGGGDFDILTFHVRKREYLNRTTLICKTAQEVGNCRSKCYDALMEERASCRLPFMINSAMEMCRSSKTFNATMEIAYSLLKNYSEDKWCNCPRKCSEYFYGINLDKSIDTNDSKIAMSLEFTNNIFQVTKEYQRTDVKNLIANICGSLGLFLGFSLLTVFEFIEAFILIIHGLITPKRI